MMLFFPCFCRYRSPPIIVAHGTAAAMSSREEKEQETTTIYHLVGGRQPANQPTNHRTSGDVLAGFGGTLELIVERWRWWRKWVRASTTTSSFRRTTREAHDDDDDDVSLPVLHTNVEFPIDSLHSLNMHSKLFIQHLIDHFRE